MINDTVIKKTAQEYGTPFYIFDFDELTKRVNQIKRIFGEQTAICYAIKANPFLVDRLKPLIRKYEVCSPGEFAICEREQVNMAEIVLSGVNKEKEDIEYVIDRCKGVGMYTVESLSQLEILSDCASERKIKLPVLLRLTSGNQFGLDEETIKAVIRDREQYAYIEFEGIQCYSGTQKKKTEQIEKEVDRLDCFCDTLKSEYGFTVKELEYGPGLPVAYFEPDTVNEPNTDEMLLAAAKKLDKIKNKYMLTVEIGRYIAAACGIYVSRIVDLKTNHNQNYCIIDGGINHINYYGQTMAMKVPKLKCLSIGESAGGGTKSWNICGSLCTAADVVVKNVPVEDVKTGDLFVFYNAGAYSVTEGIYLFLSRKLPKILAYRKEYGISMLRDSLSTDILNSRQ